MVKILLIADSLTDARLVENLLIKTLPHFRMQAVDNEHSMVAAVAEFQPDVVISGYSMPLFDGMQALKTVHRLSPDTPVIIITGSINGDAAIECINAGAADFVIKEHDWRLGQAVLIAMKQKKVNMQKEEALARLLESERKYHTLCETMSQGVICHDREGNIISVNPPAERIIGIPAGMLTGKSIFSHAWGITSADGIPLKAPEYPTCRALETGERAEAIIAIIHPETREHIWLRVNAIPEFREGETRPFQVYSTIEDITRFKGLLIELNDMNKSLEEQVELRTREILELSGLHQSILGNAGLAIVATSADGLIRLFNPAAEKLLGYTASEVTGKSTPMLFYDPQEIITRVHNLSALADENIHPAQYLDFLARKFDTHTDECHFIRKDGSRLPIRVTISSYTDQSGQKLGTILIFRDITREILATKALRRSEEQFQAMFLDHAAVMLLVSPDDGRIIQANRAARQFYGYSFSPEENLHLGDINQTPPEELQVQMQEAKNTHKNCFVFPHRLASGEIRTVEVHSSPIEVAGEKVLFSIIHDITERKITEERLVKSELENRAILNALPDTLYKIDSRGMYHYAHCTGDNKPFLHREQLIGKCMHDVLPEQVATLATSMLQKALETSETVTFEYSLPDEEGISYFENRMVALPDSEVLSMVRNITKKTLAIQATQRSELFLKMMTVNSPLAFMVVDNNTDDIIFHNPKYCEIWAICDPEQPACQHLKHKKFIDQSKHLVQDPDSYIQLIERLSHIEERAEVKETIALKDDKYLFMHSAQIRGQNDEYYGRLFIFEDVTEKEQLTNSLKEAIAREQKISKVKSRFVTMASHEFRTPIATILMASETLLHYYERMNRNDLNRYLLKINHNIQFLREIIDKFLDLSKIELGKIPFSPEKLRLSEFIDQWQDAYISRHNLNHNLIVREETLDAYVHADKQLMLQVMDNLLSNCIKYSPEQTDVVIQAERSGENVIISIADQGIGIPDEDQEKLFQTFFRASNSQKVQGTGLGLPLCKQVIEHHQGHIWIKSAVNEGTTVYFSLPLIASVNGNGSHETEYYLPDADLSENRLQ